MVIFQYKASRRGIRRLYMLLLGNSMPKSFCLFLVPFFLIAENARSEVYGTTPVGWIVHKDEYGAVLPESESAARKMQSKASSMGYVTLWLYLNTDSPPLSQIIEEAEYGRACVRTLEKLVNQNIVWHPSVGPINYGPVCLVRASSIGVGVLLRDKNFKQIMASNPPFLP